MSGLGTTRVEDVMVTAVLTVRSTDKMESVAKLFDEHDINAAPVVDAKGACVGIITSHDLVEYESVRASVENEMKHGTNYDLGHYGSGDVCRLPRPYFDEVGFHMTKSMETATIEQPLSHVARKMCQKHIHHVLVLDEQKTPIGMLSSLDILGFITGEPVCRTSDCKTS